MTGIDRSVVFALLLSCYKMIYTVSSITPRPPLLDGSALSTYHPASEFSLRVKAAPRLFSAVPPFSTSLAYNVVNTTVISSKTLYAPLPAIYAVL